MAKDSAKNHKQESSYEDSLKAQGIEEPKYSSDDQKYRKWLLERLERARNLRESPHDEFDGRSYTDHYVANFKAGNAYIMPRKNPEDTNIVTGTTREKILAIVSAVLNLNFETVMRAFDKNDTEDTQLGEAMSDMIEKSEKVENWDDKKIFAYFELATQGDVFIEENFVTQTKTDKERIPLDQLDEQTLKNYKAKGKQKDVFQGCLRNILAGTQVYLGNIRERNIRNQPYLFTKDIISYEEAKSIYGEWARFKNVPRKLVETPNTNDQQSQYGMNWRLGELPEGMVEVLKYQDKWNDEYQIFLNGVMMLPVGFPMPWEYGEYNIVQGSLEPISPFFAYSKSTPAKTKVDQEVLDETVRQAVLKGQKSLMPPIANYSANILSRTAFLPGKVNNDLTKGDIEVVGGDPGMYALKPSELELIAMLKKFIDEKSINPVLEGQQPTGDPTATQMNIVTQEARKRLGLIIFGFINFHNNLAMLRTYDILENYTKENGTKLNKVTDAIEAKYRTVTIEKSIEGRGKGVKQIQFTDQMSNPEALYDLEEGISRGPDGKTLNVTPPEKPQKITQLSPKALRQVKYNWYADTTPSEKETSLVNRIAFDDTLQRTAMLFGIQNINMDEAKQRWAVINKLNPDTFFMSQSQMPMIDPLATQAPESKVTSSARISPPGVKQAAQQGA
jgi:hypothetical protein